MSWHPGGAEAEVIALWLGLAGCGDDDGKGGDATAPIDTAPVDEDGDGWTADVDCDDDAYTVNPGVVDLAYDGVDQDCAGDDDYDYDGDGARSADYGGDDCADANPDVGPQVPEAPYNGLDDDCDPGTPDDDLDGDLFLSLYDCDDEDTGVFPGAPERAFDGVDSDCDGEPDASPFARDPVDYVSLSHLRAVDTDEGVVLGATSGVASGGPAFPKPIEGITVLTTLPHELLGPAGEPLAFDDLYGRFEPDPLADFDLEASRDGLAAGVAWFSSVNRHGYLATQPLVWIPGSGWFRSPLTYTEVVFREWSSVDVEVAGAEIRAIAGAVDGIGYVVAGGASGDLPGVDGAIATFSEEGDLVACDGATCVSHDVTPDGAPPAPSAAQPFAGLQAQWVRSVGGQRTVRTLDPGLRWTDGEAEAVLFASSDPLDGQVVRDGDEVWGLAVVPSGSDNDLVLAHGPLAGPFEEAIVPVSTGAALWVPTGAALVVRPDRVFLLVSGASSEGEILAWTALVR